MRPIEEIEAELRQVQLSHDALRHELREAQLAACPVKVGDVLRVSERTKPEPFAMIVRIVRLGWNVENPDLTGSKRTKSGAWSKATQHVYGTYEVIGHEDI